MKREKTWRERRIDWLRFDYGLYAERWENENDDRKVMSNTYYQIIEALESLPAEPPAWVCVAITDKIHKDEALMSRIILKYRQGQWGEPVEPTLQQKMERWPNILSRMIAC